MSKITVIPSEITESLFGMITSKDIHDVQLAQDIIKEYCNSSEDGIFNLIYKNKSITLNIKATEKKFWFNYLYGEICRLGKNKPSKNKQYHQNG